MPPGWFTISAPPDVKADIELLKKIMQTQSTSGIVIIAIRRLLKEKQASGV